MLKILSATLLALATLAGDAAAQARYTTESTTNVKAQKAYLSGREQAGWGEYAGAMRAYSKALEADPLFIDAWIFRGGAHLYNQHWADAEQDFEKALGLSPDYHPMVLFTCALAEWEQDKFDEVANHVAAFLQTGITDPQLQYEAQRLLENARFAAQAVQNPVPFNPQPLDSTINTPSDEYLPSFTADGQTMIFTRRDGNDENFYMSLRLPNGAWTKAEPLEGVNTSQNEGAESVNADGSWLVFTACNRRGDGSQGSCDIYWSQRKDDGWSTPRPFSKAINSADWDAQPCISPDGQTIFFSSERPGGQGGKDLWFTQRLGGGRWAEPQNLGPAINTKGHEQTPFLHQDGQTLYFTSDGHPGMGKNDLYLSRRQPDGAWGPPQNLGYPINTKAHEGTLTVSLDGQTAYFAANRPDSRGGADIYAFELPVNARPQPVTYVKAVVKDAQTGYPMRARVEFLQLPGGESFVNAFSKDDGSFLVCLPAGKDYALNVSQKGYLFHSENFQLSATATFDEPFLLTIELQPLGTDEEMPKPKRPVVLRNIFFQTGSAELLEASTAELNRLTDLLTENPALRIQINGHTDNVGSETENQKLSEARAKAVYQYLLDHNIAPERLKYKGFGESSPLDTNDTETGRARNRRTEFESW